MDPIEVDVEALTTQIMHLLEVIPTSESKLAVLERVRLQLITTTLTPELIEARQYTLVSVVLDAPGLPSEKFLVSAKAKDQALILAQKYVDQQGWKLSPWNDGTNRLFVLYPGNYIKKARRLFAAGKYI